MPSFLTQKDIIREFLECGKNPVYFISTYCVLFHPQKQRIPFKLWDFQEDLIRAFQDYPHNIILKSRQLGVSWVSAGYAAWLMMFHREKNIMVIATQFKTAANIVKKVKFMIKNLPPWFVDTKKGLASIKDDNKTSFSLTNGSVISAASTATDVGRSEALSLLIIDEAAHIEGLDELWAAAGPTLAAGGRSIALSSPNGVAGWFYKQYISAEKGENEFHPIKLDWRVHPERDDEWEAKERKRFSPKQFQQEYEGDFLAGGETFVDLSDLSRIEKIIKKPLLKTGFDRNLWVWEVSTQPQTYFIPVDVARGDGMDFSGCHVFNLETMNQAAEYKGKLEIELYSKLLYELGQEYNNAMIIVENNMLGWEVCQKLIKMGYPNVYFEEKGTHEYVPPYQALGAENVVPGFTTGPKNRLLMLSKMEEYIRRGFIIINSERTFDELRTFVWNKGKPEAQKEKNDDLVMPMAIGCWVRETVLKESIRTLQYKKTFLQSMKVDRRILNTNIPGMRAYNQINGSDLVKPQQINQNRQFAWVTRG